MKFKNIYQKRDFIFLSLLGTNFSNGEYRKLGVCDEENMDSIIDIIILNNTETIVLDCSSMVYKDDQKVFEKFCTHPQLRDRKIIFFNLKLRLLNRLRKDLITNSYNFNYEHITNSYFSKHQVNIVFINIQSSLRLTAHIVNSLINNDKAILKKCCQDHRKNGFKLSSTSLWTNYYIEIASILKTEPQSICWLISRLCNKFRDSIPEKSPVLVACTSLNSTIITTMVKESLSESYQIDIICFDRLGPDLKINEQSLSNQSKYETVLYLCDFIVGGTEFKILKALLSLRKIEISEVIAIGSFQEFEDTTIDNIPFDRIFHLPDVFPKLKYGLTKKQVV